MKPKRTYRPSEGSRLPLQGPRTHPKYMAKRHIDGSHHRTLQTTPSTIPEPGRLNGWLDPEDRSQSLQLSSQEVTSIGKRGEYYIKEIPHATKESEQQPSAIDLSSDKAYPNKKEPGNQLWCCDKTCYASLMVINSHSMVCLGKFLFLPHF